MSTIAKLPVVFVCALVVMLALGTVVTTRSLAQGPGGRPSPGNGVAALASEVAALTTEVSTLQTNLNTLTSAVDGLQTNVAKLDGQITASDLVGTYQLFQIQNELDPPVTGVRAAEIGAYVARGTATLNSNGTGSVTADQKGNFLIVNQTSLVSADQPSATLTFDWTYSNGVITLSNPAVPDINGLTINVAAGGRVIAFVSSKHTDGTDALIIMTRL